MVRYMCFTLSDETWDYGDDLKLIVYSILLRLKPSIKMFTFMVKLMRILRSEKWSKKLILSEFSSNCPFIFPNWNQLNC